MAKETVPRHSDTEQLHQLGYAQELKRGMGAFSNFAVSFTIISILSGCLTLFGFGMVVGGPASSAYGWPLVGIMVTFVALAMAEVCSSYRTSTPGASPRPGTRSTGCSTTRNVRD